MNKTVIELGNPIQIGFCVLELSKYENFNFLYNFLKPQYGSNLKIILSDTDSFLTEIKTNSIFEDMVPFLNKFDTSNFPKSHFLYSKTNKAVCGSMKFEHGNIIIKSVCALRSKMYSFTFGETNQEQICAKGIPFVVQKNELKFENYKKCLFQNKITKHKFSTIRSYKNKLYTITQNKKGLSNFDDKRYVLDQGIHTLAFGHWQIPYIEIIKKINSGENPQICKIHNVYVQMCTCRILNAVNI
jgi:hypothetical protein